jgi:hypothetical protein
MFSRLRRRGDAMKARRLAWILAFLTVPTATAARAQGPPDPRGELGDMEAVLDQVVRKVSEPAAAPFFGGGEASHAYRLAGYGALFVVPPRALPRAGKVVIVHRQEPEESVVEWSERAPAELATSDMERTMSELHDREVRIQREIQAQTRSRSRENREKELRAIEEKVEALQREAQRARQDAERALEKAMQEAMRDVQVRLTSGESVVAVAPPAPPSAPGPLPPPAAMAPLAPLPPAPPWRFWFNSEERDDPRGPERVVADVKAAVAQALETHGARLHSVRPDEFVTVAVDFVSPWGFDDETRTEKTVIVRVRKRDLEERQAGKIASEELKKRFEYVEY